MIKNLSLLDHFGSLSHPVRKYPGYQYMVIDGYLYEYKNCTDDVTCFEYNASGFWIKVGRVNDCFTPRLK